MEMFEMYERMDRLIKEINSEGVLRASQALPTPKALPSGFFLILSCLRSVSPLSDEKGRRPRSKVPVWMLKRWIGLFKPVYCTCDVE